MLDAVTPTGEKGSFHFRRDKLVVYPVVAATRSFSELQLELDPVAPELHKLLSFVNVAFDTCQRKPPHIAK